MLDQLATPRAASQDRFWDFFQNDLTESFRGSHNRLKYLVRQVPSAGAVLNIGVGAGIFEQLALERKIDVFAIDPSERTIASLRQRFGLADKAQVGYGHAMPFDDDFFSAVVVSEVLEHLTDEQLEATLQEIHRVLRPGGFILGTVPARERLSDNLIVCLHCNEKSHRWGHHQSFDCSRMARILSRYFHVQRIFERPFVNWPTLNWKGRAAGAAKLFLAKVGIHGSGENIVFQASKLPAASPACPTAAGSPP